MTRPHIVIILTLCLAFDLAPCHVPAQTEANTQGKVFTLFYSNDVHGETEPCG
jgi:hypothetical protein